MKPVQLPLPVVLRSTASFDNYYAGPNREAVAALREIAHAPGPGMVLSGAPNSGKSHLLTAAVRSAFRSGQQAQLLDAATVRAHGPAILDGLEAPRLLAVDLDEQAYAVPELCLALMRCLDRRRTLERPTLVALREAPARMRCALPDLRTRLSALPSWGLRELSDLHRENLLAERMAERGLETSPAVLRWMLSRLPRDVPALLAALERLDAACLAARRRRVTIPLARATLDDLLPPAREQTATPNRTP